MNKLHKLTIKKLIKLCSPSLRSLKWEFTTMTHEQKILSILEVICFEIFKRNKENVSSLKFSDYIKNEPYLDHYLLKICKELDNKKNEKIKKPKQKTKKFGIFDVAKLQKKKDVNNLDIKPKILSKKEAFSDLDD